jgi:hypothetical protein
VKEKRISVPELGLIAGTRGALGFGLGLLLADRWSADQRRAIGWTLFLVGLVSTVPLALEVLGRPGLPPTEPAAPEPGMMRDRVSTRT